MSTTHRFQIKKIVAIASIAAVLGLGGVVAIGALTDTAPPPVSRAATEAEASAALTEVVQLGLSSTPASVCGALAASPTMCHTLLDADGAAPRGHPITIGSEVVPDQTIGGGRLQGGRLVTVCGLRTDGTTYRTEMLLWVRAGRTEILHPVWWAGNEIVTEGLTDVADGSIGGIVTAATDAVPDDRCPTAGEDPDAGSAPALGAAAEQ